MSDYELNVDYVESEFFEGPIDELLAKSSLKDSFASKFLKKTFYENIKNANYYFSNDIDSKIEADKNEELKTLNNSIADTVKEFYSNVFNKEDKNSEKNKKETNEEKTSIKIDFS